MAKPEKVVKTVKKRDVASLLKAVFVQRAHIKQLVAEEKELTAELVSTIGEADGIVAGGFRATLARCDGNTSWREVAEALIRHYDVPPSVLAPIVDASKGDGYVRVVVKQLEKESK